MSPPCLRMLACRRQYQQPPRRAVVDIADTCSILDGGSFLMNPKPSLALCSARPASSENRRGGADYFWLPFG